MAVSLPLYPSSATLSCKHTSENVARFLLPVAWQGVRMQPVRPPSAIEHCFRRYGTLFRVAVVDPPRRSRVASQASRARNYGCGHHRGKRSALP